MTFSRTPISPALRLLALAATTLTFTACSSGGGGGGGGTTTPGGTPPTVDLNGSWQITETVTNATGVCAGEVGTLDSYTINVAQSGASLQVSTPAGMFSGSLSGDRLAWTGSFPEDGGTTTITSMSLQATDTTLSGSTQWSWTDGFQTCTGSTSVNGTRLSGGTSPLRSGDGEVEIVWSDEDLPEGFDYALARAGESGALEWLGALLPGARFSMAAGVHELALVAKESGEAATEELDPVHWIHDVVIRSGECTVVMLTVPVRR